MKIIKALIILTFLCGCGRRAVIEQKIKQSSFVHDTYDVTTYIWIRRGFLDIGDIEWSKYKFDAKRNQVDSELKSQKVLAEKYKLRIDSVIHNSLE